MKPLIKKKISEIKNPFSTKGAPMMIYCLKQIPLSSVYIAKQLRCSPSTISRISNSKTTVINHALYQNLTKLFLTYYEQ